MSEYVIGIDLGTTNTCAAVFLNGKLKLLENAEGERVTPSFVYFLDVRNNKTIVGPYGKKMAAEKPELGICEFKRLIGCDFSKIEGVNQYPYIINKTEDGKIEINLKYAGRTIVKTPEEVTSMLLKKIKTDVSAKLGSNVEKAVITVPAYFSVERREATLEAAKMAGFKVLKLLNEPTAAALSFFFEFDEDQSDSYYLVYDLGGGTFDVAVMNRNGGKIETLAVDGDSHLGGKDFDVLIVDYVYKWLKNNKLGIPKDKRTMRRIQIKCEEAKKSLSFVDETNIILEGFIPGYDVINIALAREEFEKMISGLLKRTIDIIDLCLKSAKIGKFLIKEVILSGGCTRIPKVKQLLSEYFDNKVLYEFMNPDECVAEGAAIQAAMFSDNPKQRINNISIIDVLPLSVGFSSIFSKMCFVIPKNTAIPASYQYNCSTLYKNQKIVTFRIYEGERTDVRKNRHLGKLRLVDITPLPPGLCKIILHFNLDFNGILTIRAEEENCNNTKELKVEYTRGRRSDEEIKNTLEDAERSKIEDEAFVRFNQKKTYLYSYCLACRYNFEEQGLVNEYSDLYDKCHQTRTEIYHYEIDQLSEIEDSLYEMESLLKPLVEKYKFKCIPTL